MYSRQPRYQEPEQSIYNLIPQPEPEQLKSKMYRSKYPADTPPTASTFGRSTASQILTTNLGGNYESPATNHRFQNDGSSLGPKNLHYSDPTSFQKSNMKPALPQPKRFMYTDQRKPNVIRRDQMPSMALKTSKNYVTENALSVIMAAPGGRKPDNANYLKKADYGKVPKYLKKVKGEISVEKEYIRQVMAQEREAQMSMQPKMKALPEQERLQLLDNLKKKWEAVNKQYQGMTHIVTLDTIGKVRRKEEYESQLQQLEKSIEKLSKKFVYVQEGDPYYGY